MNKKLISILLIVLLITHIIYPVYTKAGESYNNYVALGDSIAYGYGLSNKDTQCYADIVRSKYNIDKNHYKNMAVSGKTCEEYYQLIQTDEYTKAIKNANLITISIGSNELLEIATGAMSNVTGIPANDPAFLTKAQQVILNAGVVEKAKMIKEIYDFFTSEETKIKIDTSIKSYESNWDKSIKYIKEINPNATIVVTEFYNPYYELALGSLDISGFVDENIQKMNLILHKYSNSEQEYKIAKIYEDFNTTDPRITNVSISLSSFSLDPHPNVAGHKIIATKVIDSLKDNDSKQKTNISTLTISEIKDQLYTGKEVKPEISIKNGDTLLKENIDYTTTYINNIEIGEAKVNIIGIGNYTGTVVKTFNINNVAKKDIDNLTLSKIEDKTYTGIKITPDVEIKDDNKKLVSGVDYILKYQNNIDIGTATIVISGIGNYAGKLTTNFTIIPKDISSVEIKDISSQVYTGKEIIPNISISDGSAKLVKDIDYSIEYSNNVNIGNAKIKIIGKGNYTGSIEKSFSILERNDIELKDISNVACSDIDKKIYTGKLITPEVTLTDNDKTLVKYKDYLLSYTNNINIGKATLIITGIGEYKGKIEKDFDIVQKDIKFTQIEDIPDQKLNGNELKPTVTISSDFIKLSEGKDYTLKYKNNTKEGTATIVITGIGNYKGTITKTFNIIDDDNSIVDNNDKDINEKEQTTTSDKKLPQAGSKEVIKIIAIFIILMIIFSIFKLKNKYKDI